MLSLEHDSVDAQGKGWNTWKDSLVAWRGNITESSTTATYYGLVLLAQESTDVTVSNLQQRLKMPQTSVKADKRHKGQTR